MSELKTPEERLSRGVGNFINCTDYDDAVLVMKDYAAQIIRITNAEFKAIIQNMFEEFNALQRINKKDMRKILEKYAEMELGEEVNPYLENTK
jgi:hypothetical protein